MGVTSFLIQCWKLDCGQRVRRLSEDRQHLHEELLGKGSTEADNLKSMIALLGPNLDAMEPLCSSFGLHAGRGAGAMLDVTISSVQRQRVEMTSRHFVHV